MIDEPKIICRQIVDADLDAVVDLLMRGFAERSRNYWLTGFARLAERPSLPGCPRYGMMLDRGGTPVGVMLMLFSTVETGGEVKQRCNLSSWYVDPAYRVHAGSLVLASLRRRAGVTYTNNSPARHTLQSLEAVGFVRYTAGYIVAMPALRRASGDTRIHVLRDARAAEPFVALPEHGLLLDHAAMGCLSIVLEQDGALHPFVFMRFRIQAGRFPLPIQQLIFCRQIDDFVRFAGPLGRFLLRRGTPFVAYDTDGLGHGVPGIFRRQTCAKYFRGKDRPRLGDLAYSERVVFGP